MVTGRRLAALALGLLAATARAERSPGPLSAAHQALEGDQCKSCHTDGRALANDKCLACHEPVRRRVAEGKGLHASEKVAGRDCYLCHTEHKGRGKDILGFGALGGRDRFDHLLAGWPLAGAHAKVACEQCHTKKGTFLGAPASCDGCHKSPHGDLHPSLRRCERCHSLKSWSPLADLQFDHNNPADARYPIEAKHAAVDCASCHPKALYRLGASPPDCLACHKSPHPEGSLFAKQRCALCHSARTDWKTTSFDHARQARFPLDGGHAKVACAGCHAPGRPKTPRACVGCHADPHGGRFDAVKGVKDCSGCHSAKAWPDAHRFDHLRQAGYALTGKHAEAACRRCHRGASPTEFERLTGIVTDAGVACMSCHVHENVHKKQFQNGECLRCHVAAGKNQFKPEAIDRFHGPAARFPLTEGHEGVACDGCHKNDVYQGTPVECGPKCHQDKLHKGTLGDKCTRCHEGGHWPASRFDHDDTAYPLVGHHADVACELCHPARAYRPTSQKCVACHAGDDAHQGTLGPACERCHTPSGRSLFDHNDPAAPNRFRLDGKHQQVQCRKCHPTTVFPKVPTTCEGCHREPPGHLGAAAPTGRGGIRCTGCHNAAGWRVLHDGHQTGAFRFGGAHDRQPCAACHPSGRSLRGTAELCVSCHRRDDIHHNALGPRCGECHFQQTWSGPQVRFFHERTGCDLRGVHRVLPCLGCHVGGNFAALQPSCVSCHRGDALQVKSPDHKALLGQPCSGCHNVNFWGPKAVAAGGESVCQ